MTFKNKMRVVFRPAGKKGGATGGHNDDSLAVCAALDADDKANDKLEDAIVSEFRRFKRKGRMVSKPSIRPHSAVRSTSCPGDSLRGRVKRIQARVRSGA